MDQDLPDPVIGIAEPAPAQQQGGCGGGGTCGCGAATEPAPVLDVRAIPHAVRHAAVLGALSDVPLGSALVLLAPHDPLPLLREIKQREPEAFAVDYDSAGPETWAVKLTRVG